MSSTKFRVCCLMVLLSTGLARAVFPPPLPSINTANVFNVTNYGAVGDGVTTNTIAISNAIVAASAATAGVGGGTVEIPGPGTYLCGPLTMKSKVNLQVDSGATLMMLPYGSWPSAASPFISGSSLHDCTICGSGTIDGQGAAWWAAFNSSGIVGFHRLSGRGAHRQRLGDRLFGHTFPNHIRSVHERGPV